MFGSVNRAIALSAASAYRGRRDEALLLARQAAELGRATDANVSHSLALEHLAGMLHETDPDAAIATLEEVAELDAAWGNAVGADRVARTLDGWRSGGAAPSG
jgi:hypothetical protein